MKVHLFSLMVLAFIGHYASSIETATIASTVTATTETATIGSTEKTASPESEPASPGKQTEDTKPAEDLNLPEERLPELQNKLAMLKDKGLNSLLATMLHKDIDDIGSRFIAKLEEERMAREMSKMESQLKETKEELEAYISDDTERDNLAQSQHEETQHRLEETQHRLEAYISNDTRRDTLTQSKVDNLETRYSELSSAVEIVKEKNGQLTNSISNLTSQINSAGEANAVSCPKVRAIAEALCNRRLGCFVPVCEGDEYGAVQCEGSVCYCVSKLGQTIGNYSFNIGKTTDCSCARDQFEGSDVMCRDDGSYVHKCPADWTKFENSCYLHNKKAATFEEAENQCKALGAHLMKIDSEQKNVHIINNIGANAAWIGLRDEDKNETWSWVADDTKLTAQSFKGWAVNQPQGGNEDCAVLRGIGISYPGWHDYTCSSKFYSICESSSVAGKPGQVLTKPEQKATDCGEGWQAFNGLCYKVVNETVSWESAQTSCLSMGAHMATINNEEENNFVFTLAQGKGEFRLWIGLTDEENEEEWVWTNGQRASFFKWRGGEPNNFKNQNEDCVEMVDQAVWNDNRCNLNRRYMCQK